MTHLPKNVVHLKILNAMGKVSCSTISGKFCQYQKKNIYAKCIYAKQNHSFKKYQLQETSYFGYLRIFTIFDEIIAYLWEKK